MRRKRERLTSTIKLRISALTIVISPESSALATPSEKPVSSLAHIYCQVVLPYRSHT